jgi:hypothetical protein
MIKVINSVTLETNEYDLDIKEALVSQYILDSKMTSKLDDPDYRAGIRKQVVKATYGYCLGDLWAKEEGIDNKVTRKIEGLID